MAGNMYDWIDITLNPLMGECSHQCPYCYVKDLKRRFPNLKKRYSGKYRLDEKALARIEKIRNKTIFICSCNDLFSGSVPIEIKNEIINRCMQAENATNTFVFQSKNPINFEEHFFVSDRNILLGTTIETNKEWYGTFFWHPNSNGRYTAMKRLREMGYKNLFISIEPIMDFDLDIFLKWIVDIKPLFVVIGADSKNNKLPEPSWDKIQKLISGIKEAGIEVREKKNLERLKRRKN